MAIVTISKRTFSGASELAQYTSEKLGYTLVSREQIIKKTAQYGLSDGRLDYAFRRRLGLLPRLDLGWKHYLVYNLAALTKKIRQGSLLYVGDNGRALLRDFPNVLHVEVVADMEYRIDKLLERTDYVINRKKAGRLIEKSDEKAARWRRTLHPDGWHEPSEFDLVIKPELISIPDACELIRATLEQPRFRATFESLEIIDLLTVAAELRARIAMKGDVADDDVEVVVQNGVIVIRGSVRSTGELDAIKDLLSFQPGD